MKTEFAGVTIRSKDTKHTIEFYTKLGLTATAHQHVGGPTHFAVEPCVENVAVEIYAASTEYQKNVIMLFVESIEEILEAVKELGIKPKMEIKTGPDFRLTYIAGPDDFDVLLLQKTTPKR